jgi:hypothetical protein
MHTFERLFDYAVAGIQESKDLNTTTLNDLQAYLESHEIQMSERSSDTIDQAFKAPENMTNEAFMQLMVDCNQIWHNFRGRERFSGTN